ncbi:MAG: gliding motility-associated C-terminal domain-containing protein [Flavobacteriales bacterium]|nr:gliding motility-associated C-terminal domain-containing protein [Flavobacteriales bacterium]
MILAVALSATYCGVRAQQLGGYQLADALVSAVHPNGCSAGPVLGFPDQLTWVNMSNNSVMTGLFSGTWMDAPGDDLLLETSFHADNYTVRLSLEGGTFSAPHGVSTSNWIPVPNVEWTYYFTNCDGGVQVSERLILPLDFALDFGVTQNEVVTGVEITFLNTSGVPDLAGVYIIELAPCDSILELGPDTTLCSGDVLTLDATLGSGIYRWQDGSNASTFNVSEAGTYTVQVITPCDTLTDSIVVGYEPAVSLDLGADTVLCVGEPLLLDASVTGARYLWQDGDTLPTHVVDSAGTYVVTVTTNCAVRSDSIQVDYVTFPVLDLGGDTTLCDGDTMVLDAMSPGATYRWQDGAEEATFTVLDPGVYRVELASPCGVVLDSITVVFAPRPSLELGDDTTLCEGSELHFDVTAPAATYRWQDNSTEPTFVVVEGGLYWVALSLNGCTVRDSIMVQGLPLPTTELGQDRSICSAASITLDATSPSVLAYRWQNGSTLSTMIVGAPGTYWVEVSNTCGRSVDTVHITEDPLLDLDLGADVMLCEGDEIILDVGIPGADYLWHDGWTLPTYAISHPGIYSVEITFGVCSTSDAIEVGTQDCEVSLVMPNVFTPNGDGLNDQFFPVEMRSIPSAALTIFNRWGQVVFSGIMYPRAGWSGRYVPDGTYFWEVEYTDSKGVQGGRTGVVTLLR